MVDNRPTWDEFFLGMAEYVSTRATCLRRKVGAVLVKNNQVLAAGYNGPPRKVSHCETCIRAELNVPSGERQEICKAAHAEQNAICLAAKHGVAIDGSTLYVSVTPCAICMKMLINAGVVKIKCRGQYPDQLAMGMAQEAGVEIVILVKND